jgi:hypothetical protein
MFILTLPKSSSTVKIKLLTLGDNTEISNLEKTYPKGRVTPTITWRLNKQILEVDGNSDRLFISKFIDTLPIADSKYIRNFVRDNQPSLDLKKEVLAPSGEIVTANVTFGVEFFRPFF